MSRDCAQAIADAAGDAVSVTFPIVIELLGHPRGKGRPRSFRMATGATGVHTDAKTREYEGNLRLGAAQVMRDRVPLTMPLRVLVEADFPVPASWSKKRHREALLGLIRPTVKPDADNIMKVLDACNGLLFRDDNQVVEAAIIKRYSDKPLLRISVWPIGDEYEYESSAARLPSASAMTGLFAKVLA